MAGRETAGATTCLLVRYVRERAGDEGVARVLERSGVAHSTEDLEDERRWFTYEEKIALFEAAATELGDPDVSRSLGEAALQHRVGTGIRVLLRTLGSPRVVIANIAKASPKFSTVATMEVVDLGRNQATLEYQLHAGKTPHRLDCLLNQGLIAVIGPLFGLPLLNVDHFECQVDGAERCVYHVRWSSRRRGGRHRHRHANQRLDDLTTHLNALQSTAADLVSPDDLSDVLQRIVTRASTAVGATRFLLAVRMPGRGLQVHSDGLSAREAQHAAESLLSARASTAEWIVEEVNSAGACYGIVAASVEGHAFFEQERSMFATYARSAAAALDAASALQEARERAGANEALLELARRISAITTPHDVAQRLAEAMNPVLGGRAALVLVTDDDGSLVIRGRHGWGAPMVSLLDGLRFDGSEDATVAHWFEAPAPSFVTIESESETARALLPALGVDALAMVPIRRRGDLLGVAGVAFVADEIPPDVDALLARSAAVADYAGIALDNARMHATIRRRAMHDELTGLPNRAYFEEQVEKALERSARGRNELALLFVDIDDFKQVNDRFGHGVGDDVLVEVAARLRTVARSGDVPARVGGDEFAMLLWGAGREQALAVAERLRAAIEEPIGDVAVSASIGIAPAIAGERFQEMVRRADLAMYDAKRRGRNLCVLDG